MKAKIIIFFTILLVVLAVVIGRGFLFHKQEESLSSGEHQAQSVLVSMQVEDQKEVLPLPTLPVVEVPDPDREGQTPMRKHLTIIEEEELVVSEVRAAMMESGDYSAHEIGMMAREVRHAFIVSRYDANGDGMIDSEEMKQYAGDRLLSRYDLNGNGKIDGFELRAMAQQQAAATSSVSDVPSNHSGDR